MGEPVDVVGLGVVSAAGADLDGFFAALLAGRPGAVPRPDLAERGIRGAQFAPWQHRSDRADPLVFAIESARTDAGRVAAEAERIALVVGTSSGGMPAAEAFFADLAAGEIGETSRVREATYHAPALAAARATGVRGPVRVVSSACASSLLAVGLARDLLLEGACDLAIAAGHDASSLFVHAGFDALGALAPGPIRPFGTDRDGLLLGEGAGAVVLARAGRAGRTHARILGFGLSGDARHVTAPDPEGRGLAFAIESALAEAGLGAGDVDFVSAHGTGTLHNDAMEARALHSALGPRARRIPVVSWKPVLGHAMGAAGVLELVGAVLALELRLLPGTRTTGPVDPECDLDLAAEGYRRTDAHVALKVSSGFGGTNAALVIGRAERS